MSRIGKKPVQIPAGVTVTIDGNHVHAKGPKGELTRHFSELVTITMEGDESSVPVNDESRESNAQHGLTRTLIHNMVLGVSDGFMKQLELTGVGYRAALKGKDLDLSLGYSHPVIYAPREHHLRGPRQHAHQREGHLQGAGRPGCRRDSQKRPPEPYKGKGIHYMGEHIRRKLGKAAK